MESKKTERIPQLDGLRGVAIASVFLHHALHVKLLWMGVDLFFVLSGYLITGILLKTKAKTFRAYIRSFYARRVRRILPPYVVIMVISTIVFGFSWMKYWYLYLGGMNFLHPLNLYTPDTLPLWSLAVEEQFYLLWPIAVFFLTRKHLKICAASILVLAPVLRYLCTPLFHSHWAIYMLLPFRMDTLAAGALIAILSPEIKENVRIHNLTIVATTLIILALGALEVLSRYGFTTYSNTSMGNFGVYESTLIIVTCFFLLALVGVGKVFFVFPPLMWLGYISYSVYLVHETALFLVPHRVVIAAIISIAYASLMWKFVEKPILEYRFKPWASTT